MNQLRRHPLVDAAGITLIRFVLMVVTLQVAAAAGVGGWDLGLMVNVVITLFSVALSADIPYRDFTVLSPDPHDFDNDNDGVGCET